MGRARQSHRQGNAVHRGQTVRRQQARRRPDQVIRRDRDRFAQHPLADRRVLSKGDNIAPPQQALGWILQLYDDVDEIRSCGQTIVYCVHESVGHLGIFVSGGVARKEYGEFASNIDLIDVLPPGLYEAVFEAKSAATANPEVVPGEWVMRCEVRTLDDIRALGGNNNADDRRFATAARMSEANLALYRTFAQPFVRACVTAPMADLMHRLHPARLQYELMSDANPFTAMLPVLAGWVREHRTPVRADNPFLAAQETVSRQIISALDAFRDLRDGLVEQIFLAVYGSPAVQAWFGIDSSSSEPFRRAPNPGPRDLFAQYDRAFLIQANHMQRVLTGIDTNRS